MKVKIAIAQFEAPHFDIDACITKASQIINEAAEARVQILVFGECWFSGYPAWLDYCPDVGLWDDSSMKDVFSKMYQNGLSIESPHFKSLIDLAKKNKMILVFGANEIVDKGVGNGTIFNSLFIISENGELIVHHRKLMPTHGERLVHGLGYNNKFNTYDSPLGQLGGLICWEHWMPLNRQALHNAGEHIHFALWPQVHEMHQLASRHYAFEGRCYVIAVGQLFRKESIPSQLKKPEKLNGLLLDGGSCIYGPDGSVVQESIYGSEQIITATLELDNCIRERMALDTSGHYSRPDVFEFNIR